MNSPAFLASHAYCEMRSTSRLFFEKKKSRLPDRNLAFEQRAQPIDCVGGCILAESTVGPPLSAERLGSVAAMLPRRMNGCVPEELVKVAVVYANRQP